MKRTRYKFIFSFISSTRKVCLFFSGRHSKEIMLSQLMGIIQNALKATDSDTPNPIVYQLHHCHHTEP